MRSIVRDCLGAAVAALHPLQDHVVAGLKRKVKVRHQPGIARDQLEERIVDLDAVERRQAKTSQGRDGCEQPLAQFAQTRAFMAVARDVDAGEDDFFRAAIKLAHDRVADRFERQRAARPARLPDGAEGTAMIAAGLDRDEASHVAEEACGYDLSIASQATDLVVVPDDAIDLGHVGEGLWIQLDRAAGDQDARVRPFATGSAGSPAGSAGRPRS